MKLCETILYIILYFYVTIRAYDSPYGVKLKAAIFICDIPAMLAFLLISNKCIWYGKLIVFCSNIEGMLSDMTVQLVVL